MSASIVAVFYNASTMKIGRIVKPDTDAGLDAHLVIIPPNQLHKLMPRATYDTMKSVKEIANYLGLVA